MTVAQAGASSTNLSYPARSPLIEGSAVRFLSAEEPLPAPAEPVVVTVTAELAAAMPRAIPALLRRAQRDLAGRDPDGVPVIVDLSAVPPLPVCASLVRLLHLLRTASGGAEIVATGVGPALVPCLVVGLPDGVRVVDRTGRRWPS
jgi:hypothetical protein